MSYPTQQFTIADPQTFDGDPFEVADRAVRQAGAIAAVLKRSLEGARIQVRNAQLERELLIDGECDAPGFDSSPQGKMLTAMIEQAEATIKSCAALARAASYNPKKPPRV